MEVGVRHEGSEWWRSGKLWLIVTLVVVFSAIALSWVHWITVNDKWVTIQQYFLDK